MSLSGIDVNSSLFLVIYIPIACTLIWAAYTDIRYRLIKNDASKILIGLFIALALTKMVAGSGVMNALGFPLLTGLITFSVTFALFNFNFLGGGDAKIMAAFSLIAGPSYIIVFILYTAILGGLVALITLAHHKLIGTPALPAMTGRRYQQELAGDIYLAQVAQGSTLLEEAQEIPNTKAHTQPKVPYGVAISASGLWVLFQQILQFSHG